MKNKLPSSIKNITNVFSFSKQNKDYEKYFNCNSNVKVIKPSKAQKSNLENILKPQQYPKKRSKSTNIIIKSRFNYISELASLDNASLNLANKNSKSTQDIKNKIYKALFQVITPKLVDAEKMKYRSKRIMKKFILKKQNNENETTLAPGKYNPKYDYVRRKYPIVILGKSKKYNSISLKDKIKSKSRNNIKEKNSDSLKTQTKISENKNTNSFYYLKKYKNIQNSPKINKNNCEDAIINKSETFKINKNPEINKKRNKLINIKESTLSNINNKNSVSLPILIEKKNEENEVKENNETEENNEIKEFTDFLNELKLHKIFYESKTKLKCPVSFEKMPGRKEIVNNQNSEVSYSPNYNSIRPHIPSTIFRYRKTFQNFKKYITGKIIRSYCYTPDSYFIFQINKQRRKNGL